MSNTHILEDGRLREPKGSKMVDWPLPFGGTIRCEAEMVYCGGGCGKPILWCPTENTVEIFAMCRECFEKYGLLAGTYAVPASGWMDAVKYEMLQRFGHSLTDVEVVQHLESGTLGTALEKLSRESPFPIFLGHDPADGWDSEI